MKKLDIKVGARVGAPVKNVVYDCKVIDTNEDGNVFIEFCHRPDKRFWVCPSQLVDSIELGVNERFESLENQYKTMLNPAGKFPLLIVKGQSGTGKTFLLSEALSKYKGYYDENMNLSTPEALAKGIVYFQGTLTPVEFYKGLLLASKENSLLILDDCDGSWHDKKSKEFLKAATGSYKTRTVSYFSKFIADAGLPEQFDFKGKVIILTNSVKIDPAIASRGLVMDVLLSRSEMVERAEFLCEKICERHGCDLEDGLEVLNLYKQWLKFENLPDDKVTIRTFESLVKLHNMTKDIRLVQTNMLKSIK